MNPRQGGGGYNGVDLESRLYLDFFFSSYLKFQDIFNLSTVKSKRTSKLRTASVGGKVSKIVEVIDHPRE